MAWCWKIEGMVGKGSNGIADDMGWWREGGGGTCGVKWLVWERLQGIDGEETEGEEEGVAIFKEVALCVDIASAYKIERERKMTS